MLALQKLCNATCPTECVPAWCSTNSVLGGSWCLHAGHCADLELALVHVLCLLCLPVLVAHLCFFVLQLLLGDLPEGIDFVLQAEPVAKGQESALQTLPTAWAVLMQLR